MAISSLGILHTAGEESPSTKKSSRRRPKFRTELFGYAKSEVRSYIARLQSDVEQSREWADTVARDLEQSRRATESQSGTPPPDKAANPQKAAHLVERTLGSAHRLADEIRQEARKEADEIVADARTRATRIIEEAIATAGDTHETAMVRLKEVEHHIALMKERHREISGLLESMVTALTQGLNEVRCHQTHEDTALSHTDNEKARAEKESVHEAIEVVVRTAAAKKMIASRVESVT
jgi:cell division septum initiation protein DivIVA